MRFAGVVLAGGASVRMGIDKADLKINDSSFLEIAINLCSQVGAERVFVQGKPNLINGLADDQEYKGPVAGIITSVKYLYNKGYNAALFVPVDMPLLKAEHLRKLIEQSMYKPCCFNKAWLPFWMPFNANNIKLITSLQLYDATLSHQEKETHAGIVSINKRVKNNEKSLSMGRFIDSIVAKKLQLPPNWSKNINTPNEYNEVIADLKGCQ